MRPSRGKRAADRPGETLPPPVTPQPSPQGGGRRRATSESEPGRPSDATMVVPVLAPEPGRRIWGLPRSWVVIGVLAILVVAAFAFAIGMVMREPPERPDPTKPVNNESTESQPQGPASEGPDVDAAAALAQLIADSVNDKQNISGAASNLKECQQVVPSVRVFQDAAASRAELVRRADQVTVVALDRGPELADNLKQAWANAMAADQAYAAWGASLRAHKGKCRGNDALLDEAVDLSVQSHPYKQAAARIWNPIAKKYGHDQVGWQQL